MIKMYKYAYYIDKPIIMVLHGEFIHNMTESINDINLYNRKLEPPPIDQAYVKWILTFNQMDIYAREVGKYQIDPTINPRLYACTLYGFATGINYIFVYNNKWTRPWRWNSDWGFAELKQCLVYNLRRPKTVIEDLLRCGSELIRDNPHETMSVEDNIAKFEDVLREMFMEAE